MELENMHSRHSYSQSQSQGVTEVLMTLDNRCKSCKTVNPLECVTRCTVWKVRNELRCLRENLENPNFMRDLLNVLKNDTRLYILQAIVKEHYSISELQQELKKEGFLHSQDTIAKEYLPPMLDVGLATEAREQFYATTFGVKLAELMQNIPEFVDFFPARSECYEENILLTLFTGPKTIREIEKIASHNIVSRTLKRLKKSDLVETPKERDYIFFFKSKRDTAKESLKVTEKKFYTSIPDEGVSAKNLAQRTDLSMRRTYKYLRCLKGKKLLFTRKAPKTYALTEKGERVAWLLNEMHKLVEEILSLTEQFAKGR